MAFIVAMLVLLYCIGTSVFWSVLGWDALLWPLFVGIWVTQNPDFIQWVERGYKP